MTNTERLLLKKLKPETLKKVTLVKTVFGKRARVVKVKITEQLPFRLPQEIRGFDQ